MENAGHPSATTLAAQLPVDCALKADSCSYAESADSDADSSDGTGVLRPESREPLAAYFPALIDRAATSVGLQRSAPVPRAARGPEALSTPAYMGTFDQLSATWAVPARAEMQLQKYSELVRVEGLSTADLPFPRLDSALAHLHLPEKAEFTAEAATTIWEYGVRAATRS